VLIWNKRCLKGAHMKFPYAQILRFCSSGAIGVLLGYLILIVLTEEVGVWYLASAIVASIVNYTSNFLFHKYWTFKDRESHEIHRQIGKYAAMVVFLFLLGITLLYILVECLRLWYLFAQLIVTGVVTVISYLISRRIFANEKTAASSP